MTGFNTLRPQPLACFLLICASLFPAQQLGEGPPARVLLRPAHKGVGNAEPRGQVVDLPDDRDQIGDDVEGEDRVDEGSDGGHHHKDLSRPGNLAVEQEPDDIDRQQGLADALGKGNQGEGGGTAGGGVVLVRHVEPRLK